MKPFSIMLIIAVACLACPLSLADEPIQPPLPPRIIISIDRADGLYQVGDKVAFTLRLAYPDGAPVQGTMKVSYSLTRDGGQTRLPGEWIEADGKPEIWIEREDQTWMALVDDRPETILHTMTEPGFVRFNATGRYWEDERVFVGEIAAVACEPEKIEPIVSMPEDFDEFWAKGRERLAQIPLDYQQEWIEHLSDDMQNTFLVSFANINDTRIYGYLLVPKGDQEKHPAFVSVAPAGVGRPLENFVQGRMNRISQNQAICLYLGVHNVVPGQPREHYQDYVSGNWNFNVETVEDYFWYQVILGIDRAIDWLAAREDVDATRVVIKGNSQGGGVTLVMAGFNRSLTAACANIPGLCDQLAFLDDGRAPDWGAGLDYHRRRALSEEQINKAIEILPYFDAVNFARKVDIPILITMGFRDTTCPPSGVYAAYNMIDAPKEIAVDPGQGHGVGPNTRPIIDSWIRERLGLANDL